MMNGRQTDRQADRQTGRQTDSQTDRQNERGKKTKKVCLIGCINVQHRSKSEAFTVVKNMLFKMHLVSALYQK